MGNFGKWLKANWAIPLILVIAAVVLIAGSKAGWFDPKIKLGAIDPTDPNNTNDNSTPTISDTKANNLAVTLHDRFVNHYLYWDSGSAIEVMRPIYNLKDADLLTVANKYSFLYGNKPDSYERSMSSLLAAETLGMGLLENASAMRNEITTRLASLGV